MFKDIYGVLRVIDILTKKKSGVYTPNAANAVLSNTIWKGFAFNVVKSKYGGLFSSLFLSFPLRFDISFKCKIALLCG